MRLDRKYCNIEPALVGWLFLETVNHNRIYARRGYIRIKDSASEQHPRE